MKKAIHLYITLTTNSISSGVRQVHERARVLRPHPQIVQTGGVRHEIVGEEGVLRAGCERAEGRTAVGHGHAEVRGHADHHGFHQHLAHVLQVTNRENASGLFNVMKYIIFCTIKIFEYNKINLI